MQIISDISSKQTASKPAGSAIRFNVYTFQEYEVLKNKQLGDAQAVADSVDLGELVLKDTDPGMINPSVYYFHPDHLGSSTVITDGAGYAYQIFLNLPFGETMAEQRRSGSLNNPFKFNGKELDSETGLYYYGARYYDPRISLFISVDPLAEQTMTPYQYTYQNPVRYIDPTGMAAEDPDPPSKKKNALQRLRAKTTKWADDNIRQPIVKELKPYREYISIAREVNSEILKENLGSLYELQGMVGGSSPGYLVGGGVLGKTFKLNNSSKAKVLKSMEPLVSFKNTDELLKAAGTINPTRSGNVHKNIIQASRDEVFESIIKGNIGTTPKGYYKMLDGKIIGKHPSPNEPTIDIKLPNNKLNNKIRFSHE